ncbi:MAG: pyridoxine 5'-phosphate synthase [bacterium]
MLSVNIDHIATLRQARREEFPDPVQAATLVELGGADGITVHLRQDRRHINDRDVELLRKTVKTELTVEMAAKPDLIRFACKVRPDQVTLVPELVTELTTTRGLDVVREAKSLSSVVRVLNRAGVRVSLFVDPDPRQVVAAAKVGAQVVELNTDRYSKDPRCRDERMGELKSAAQSAIQHGLAVHVGHGLNYTNVAPIARQEWSHGFSIGFAIVSRAVFVGLEQAVREMKHILEVHS